MDHGHKDEEYNKCKEKAGFMHSSIIAKKYHLAVVFFIGYLMTLALVFDQVGVLQPRPRSNLTRTPELN